MPNSVYRASAAVIVRIPYLHTYKDPDFLCKFLMCLIWDPFVETHHTDQQSTDATTDISIWSNVEAGLGITAGSLVTLRPLFRWFRGSSYAGTYSVNKRTKGSSNIPLSSMGANSASHSRNDPNGVHFWRSDLVPDNSRAIAVTNYDSGNSSEEYLHTGESSSYPGVSVQKSFHVSTEQA